MTPLTVAVLLAFNVCSASAFARNYAPWQWRSRATDPHTESSSVKTTDEVVKFYAPWSKSYNGPTDPPEERSIKSPSTTTEGTDEVVKFYAPWSKSYKGATESSSSKITHQGTTAIPFVPQMPEPSKGAHPEVKSYWPGDKFLRNLSLIHI